MTWSYDGKKTELNRLSTLYTGHVASVQAHFSVAGNIIFWLTTLKRTEKWDRSVNRFYRNISIS
jgi:hypothetical protein